MTKIAILHQDLEYAEKAFKKVFESELKAETKLFSINENVKDIIEFKPDILLNRVYASVANRNYDDITKTIDLLQKLEDQGVVTVNSKETSIYDYSKFEAAKIMKQYGVPTPETILIETIDDTVKEFAKEHQFPLILKRDTGGRGKDIIRVTSLNELEKALLEVKENAQKENYQGKFILQQFATPNRNHDCRIAIINGKYALAYGRTLISTENEEAWLASVAKGSTMFDYKPSEEEITIAKNATKAIGAIFNEVDMAFTASGPVIIENNPTPNYDETELDRIQEAAKIIYKIYDRERK